MVFYLYHIFYFVIEKVARVPSPAPPPRQGRRFGGRHGRCKSDGCRRRAGVKAPGVAHVAHDRSRLLAVLAPRSPARWCSTATPRGHVDWGWATRAGGLEKCPARQRARPERVTGPARPCSRGVHTGGLARRVRRNARDPRRCRGGTPLLAGRLAPPLADLGRGAPPSPPATTRCAVIGLDGTALRKTRFLVAEPATPKTVRNAC